MHLSEMPRRRAGGGLTYVERRALTLLARFADYGRRDAQLRQGLGSPPNISWAEMKIERRSAPLRLGTGTAPWVDSP